MNGTILVGRRRPANLLAAPVLTGNGAGRQVDRLSMKTITGHVGNAFAHDVEREIPSCDRARLRFALTQDPIEVAYRLELAVVVPGGPQTGTVSSYPVGRHEEGLTDPRYRTRYQDAPRC
jgi:hypothetical protein